MIRPSRHPALVRAFAAAAVLALALVAAAAPASAAPGRRAGGQFRYWQADNGTDLRDYIVYYAQDWFHVQYEYWDYVAPQSHDHARPEIGFHVKDPRHSVYSAVWRHEYRRNRYSLSTDQIVGDHWVARAEISPIVWEDSTDVVLAAGADYYWGSYHYASATVIRDPRGGDFWSFPMRVRIATESNNWVQATVAPATHHSVGWALDLQYRGARVGIERNNRYDFTTEDNVIFTVGYERFWLRQK
jgi:hypothetical protein